MAHVLFGPEIRMMLQENDTAGLKALLEELHPATIAEALAGDFAVDDVWRILGNTNIRNQAAIFEYFPIEWQVEMVAGTGQQHMAHLIEKMSHDDRADLLRRLRPRVTEQLLRLVDEADRRDIAALVSFPENTAGSLMTTDYSWLPANITANEALERLRLQAPDRETIYYIYVLDEQRKLLGVVSLRDLILAPRQSPMRDLMDREVVRVKATDDQEQLAQEMARYDLLAIPVVDAEDRLIGIVTYDDIMDVVVKEATEDVHRMGGVSPMAENYLEANFFKVWRNRAFWLSCLFVAELFTFTALSYFDEQINELVVLALFVPLCISTGGNSGSQAATLITRSLALGQVTTGAWWRVIRHELVMGIALGCTLGAIGFLRGAATPEDVRGNIVTRKEAFRIRVAKETEVVQDSDGKIRFSKGADQIGKIEKNIQVILPEGKKPTIDEQSEPGYRIYEFPEESKVRTEAVNRWSLAAVIGLAVAFICLWGTLIGSMLPLFFKQIGVDPGIASSPFVATFVDVTGIIIYFSIASIYLL